MERKTDRAEIMFFIAYGIYMIAKVLEITTIKNDISWFWPMLKVIRYGTYLLIILKLLLDDWYKSEEIYRIAAVMAVMLASSLYMRNNVLVCNFLFIIAARNISLKKIFGVSLVIQGIITVLVCGGSQIGLISDWTYNLDERFRHSLGFTYPSYITTIYFFLVLLYFILRKTKITLVESLLIQVVNYLLYVLTDARTGVLLTLAAGVVFYSFKFMKGPLKSNWVSQIFYGGSLIAIAVASIAGAYFYNPNNGLYEKLNGLLSNRLRLGYNALHEYGFPILGKEIEWIGNGGYGYTFKQFTGTYNFVDCSFIKILLDNGWLVLLVVMAGYCIAAWKAVRLGNRYLAMALIFIMLYSIIEPRLIEFGFNPFVVVLAALFTEKIDLVKSRNRWELVQSSIWKGKLRSKYE